MTIVVTGGGSGGHITPILAVAHELKKLDPTTRIIYIGQRGDALADIPAHSPDIDEVCLVWAGKLRRYHNEGWRQLLDLPTDYKNLRDMAYIVIGTIQSWRLMRELRPSIIFTRGGFVSVPVAIGGLFNGVPYITHDSDSTPSLANRLIARWARRHAVALPEEFYPYPRQKTITVGVPVSTDYRPVAVRLLEQYRREIGLTAAQQLVLITGGGNGSNGLNQAVIANAGYLLQRYPGLVLVHIAGRALAASVRATYDEQLDAKQRRRVIVKSFIDDLYRYSAVADVVVARGGATNLAEFAIQAKACVIIPSPQLIWNVKNTDALAEHQAVIKLDENQAEQDGRLAAVIGELLSSDAKRLKLGQSLAQFARPDAAERLAKLLIEAAAK
jgi:UDP-N-acetylglucosamine--N-acetylmuramyl-(pentapeptide) pyrophosphoryl-undecaprenol N-acetylglucosamine transferase